MVDAHDFFYETDLLHVFRIPDTGDRFLTAQTFGKGWDDDVFLIITCSCDHKVIRCDIDTFKDFDLFCIGVDRHNIHLRADFLQNIFIGVDDRNVVISAQ